MPVQTKIVEKNDDVHDDASDGSWKRIQKIIEDDFKLKLDSNVKIVKS